MAEAGVTMECPYCKTEDTFTYYKALMPNILSACPESMLGRVKLLPFEAKLCKNCLLGFNASKLDDSELKSIYDDYLYISPMRGIGRTKYEGMIALLKKFFSNDDDIVEVGCSEGYLLDRMRTEGYRKLTGIEPGPQSEQAKSLGLNVIRGYFDEYTFSGRLIDGFYLMHVFEHFDNPFSILGAIGKQLSPQGKIIIEVPDFEGYHHQHLFFYNTPYLIRLCHDKGLKIVEVEKEAENDSLRVVAVHADNSKYYEVTSEEQPDEIISLAEKRYRDFNELAARLARLLISADGGEIYWWGAGSASVVYLNQIDREILGKSKITVVDGDKNKWGMFIPGLNVRVNPFGILENRTIDTLVIASEFHREIIETCTANKIFAKKVEVFR